jgi:hypothetical protein
MKTEIFYPFLKHDGTQTLRLYNGEKKTKKRGGGEGEKD